jgi:hypothetical protein
LLSSTSHPASKVSYWRCTSISCPPLHQSTRLLWDLLRVHETFPRVPQFYLRANSRKGDNSVCRTAQCSYLSGKR